MIVKVLIMILKPQLKLLKLYQAHGHLHIMLEKILQLTELISIMMLNTVSLIMIKKNGSISVNIQEMDLKNYQLDLNYKKLLYKLKLKTLLKFSKELLLDLEELSQVISLIALKMQFKLLDKLKLLLLILKLKLPLRPQMD